MKLYLLRHGIAGQRRPGSDDNQRPLTKSGRYRARCVARALARLGVRFHRAYASPLLRARQTAAIVCTEVRGAPRVRLHAALAPGGDHRLLLRSVARSGRDGDTAVLLVGHEPALSELTALLVCGGGACAFDWRKAGLCLVEVTRAELRAGRGGRLRWFLPPKVLLRLR